MLQARVRRTLQERRLVKGVRRAVVGCSGGPDSSALLHVLHAVAPGFGLQLVAVGVDHGLRPEARGELDLAQALARRLGLPFDRRTLSLAPGPDLQARAREARYEQLLASARQHDAQAVAVGHTLDDQAETVLGRLLRGASIAGLAGIEPRRQDGVLRPLIDCRRSEVDTYISHHDLQVARDPSNVDRAFTRARLRHDLLPQLRREDPAVEQHLAQLAQDARDAWEVVCERARARLERTGVEAGGLREEPRAVRRCALRMWALETMEVRLGRAHLDSLDRLLLEGGEVRLPGGLLATLDAQARLQVCSDSKRGRGSGRPKP